jgi:hypothetical protein
MKRTFSSVVEILLASVNDFHNVTRKLGIAGCDRGLQLLRNLLLRDCTAAT